jgi:hypothetical protein
MWLQTAHATHGVTCPPSIHVACMKTSSPARPATFSSGKFTHASRVSYLLFRNACNEFSKAPLEGIVWALLLCDVMTEAPREIHLYAGCRYRCMTPVEHEATSPCPRAK